MQNIPPNFIFVYIYRNNLRICTTLRMLILLGYPSAIPWAYSCDLHWALSAMKQALWLSRCPKQQAALQHTCICVIHGPYSQPRNLHVFAFTNSLISSKLGITAQMSITWSTILRVKKIHTLHPGIRKFYIVLTSTTVVTKIHGDTSHVLVLRSHC